MTSVRGQSYLTQKSQASKALTNWSNNKDHKNPLGLNKLRPSKAPTRLEALAGPSQALLPPKAPDVA